MSDLDQLRSVGNEVRPPSFDSLVTTARRRTRRTAAGVVAAFITVVMLIGGGMRIAGDIDRSAPGPANRPTSPSQVTTTPKPTTPTYSPGMGAIFELPQEIGPAILRQGRYAVRVTPTLSYEVYTPDQVKAVNGSFLNTRSASGSGWAGIFFVSTASAEGTILPAHPCRDHTGRVVGPTVSDLAGALRRQPLLDVSKPQVINVDGYQGLWVDVRIPIEVDASTCVNDIVRLFSSGQDSWGWVEGFMGRWWILDVDGERVVVNAQCDTDCSKSDWRTLQAMLESVDFIPDE